MGNIQDQIFSGSFKAASLSRQEQEESVKIIEDWLDRSLNNENCEKHTTLVLPQGTDPKQALKRIAASCTSAAIDLMNNGEYSVKSKAAQVVQKYQSQINREFGGASVSASSGSSAGWFALLIIIAAAGYAIYYFFFR